MQKNLRALISILFALVVTSASAVQIGCPGLERAPQSPAAQSSMTGQ
ncbi:hypothetical protein [Deinococcus aerophilus]|uniref:Uncharacterized protein n=1 Tax=Deinococcus aerophilus TaxID=522488 RepID=A0ABQ2GMI7_9DEIO|nr:hypothetical protein [Deinococcus aerophilus]GGM02647.1 hypothetical protein GCM10010841_09020 [Deinococcus aerophilus]